MIGIGEIIPFAAELRDRQKFAISANWHGPCNAWFIGGAARHHTLPRGNIMQTLSFIGTRMAAATTAFALSLVLIGQTVSVPAGAAPAAFAPTTASNGDVA